MTDQLLTMDDVMALLQVTRQWLYRAAANRTIKSLKIGNQLRFRPADVEEFIEKAVQE